MQAALAQPGPRGLPTISWGEGTCLAVLAVILHLLWDYPGSVTRKEGGTDACLSPTSLGVTRSGNSPTGPGWPHDWV